MTEYRWPIDIRCAPPSVLTPVTRVLGAQSLFTGQTSSGGAVAEFWKLQMNFTGLTARDHRRAASILLDLSDGSNTLLIGPHDLCKPLGAAAGWGAAAPVSTQRPFSDGTLFTDGTGWTDAARQASVRDNVPAGRNTLVIAGLLPNRPDSLLAGDMMEIGGYLYACRRDTASDSSGCASVTLWPRLRLPAFAGAPVNFDHPVSPFQPARDAELGVSIGLGHLGGFGFSLVEKLPERLPL